jgi:ADP-ribosylglycohydrolase
MSSTKNIWKNGIWGLVVGDALGVPVEFTPRVDRVADPVTGMRAYGTHNQPLGT